MDYRQLEKATVVSSLTPAVSDTGRLVLGDQPVRSRIPAMCTAIIQGMLLVREHEDLGLKA